MILNTFQSNKPNQIESNRILRTTKTTYWKSPYSKAYSSVFCSCSSIPNFVQLWIQFHWNSALTLQYVKSRCFSQWLWQSFKLCQSLRIYAIASLFMFVVCSITKKMKDTTVLLHFEFSFRVDKSRHDFSTVLHLNFLQFLFHSVQGYWVAYEASFSIFPQSSSICTKTGNFSLTANFKFHFWVHFTCGHWTALTQKYLHGLKKNTGLKID